MDKTRTRHDTAVLVALLLLYAAQGLPFGIAAEYLPVAMRTAGYSQVAIAAAGWLQLPWQLKIVWAHLADRKLAWAHARILLVLQCVLAALVLAYAGRDFAIAPRYWFALTLLLAFVAASQDVFVDALAVRSLSRAARGLGNSIQVGGYRAGMLLGGAVLLLVSGTLGLSLSMALLAGFVLFAATGAFFLSSPPEPAEVRSAPSKTLPQPSLAAHSPTAWTVFRHAIGSRTWVVLALALTFKLGIHIAAPLIKVMAVDAGWSKQEIGLAVVTYGTAAGFAGALVGGLLHRWLHEPKALLVAMVSQAAACVPLAVTSAMGVPKALTTLSIAMEHFASGAGTTVLFAALMTATRKSSAGAHYTLLTSANALAIGAGGMVGGALADAFGRTTTYALGAVIALLPVVFLGAWRSAAVESARESDEPSPAPV